MNRREFIKSTAAIGTSLVCAGYVHGDKVASAIIPYGDHQLDNNGSVWLVDLVPVKQPSSGGYVGNPVRFICYNSQVDGSKKRAREWAVLFEDARPFSHLGKTLFVPDGNVFLATT